jgi:hypothetical protein
MHRNRIIYAAAVFAVIAAGLASRRFPGLLPAVLGKYPGDALWALMIYLIVGFLRPSWSKLAVAGAALGLCFAVEFGQLYHAPWIDSVRRTTLGHLVLGSAFGSLDLMAYAVGVSIGYLVELASHRQGSPSQARD